MRSFIILGAFAIASIAACSGGPGQATNLRGGPDGIPKSSTDQPGTGNEQPGGSGQDPTGASNQGAPNSCIDCSGAYACSVTGQTKTSIITLTPVSGGCGVTSDGTTNSYLACGGQFVETNSNGSVAFTGTWSGGTGHFSVTATVDGQTLSVDCVATQTQPTPVPVGTADAG